jgi:hypothetical protein
MVMVGIRWASFASVLCLAGCFGFLRDEALDGPYRLVAVDSPEDMILCRYIGAEGDCLGDGLPSATIFQAGANSQYIAVARHPRRWPDRTDRSISEYYYISRQSNESDVSVPIAVIGPFTDSEFQEEKRRLHLPDFTKVFCDLK